MITLYYTSTPPLPISSLLSFLPPSPPSIRPVPSKPSRPNEFFVPNRGAFVDCEEGGVWFKEAIKLNGVSWKGALRRAKWRSNEMGMGRSTSSE